MSVFEKIPNAIWKGFRLLDIRAMDDPQDETPSYERTNLSIREICAAPSKPVPSRRRHFNRYVEEECVGEVEVEGSQSGASAETELGRHRDDGKPRRTKKWTREETLKLYTGIMKYGPDFGLIELMFPNRTRKQIKAKFKAEERVRPMMVEKALKAQQTLDASLLEETLQLIGKPLPGSSEEEVVETELPTAAPQPSPSH